MRMFRMLLRLMLLLRWRLLQMRILGLMCWCGSVTLDGNAIPLLVGTQIASTAAPLVDVGT